MKTIDLTELLDNLDLMIRVVDRLSEERPIPDSIRRLRDRAADVASQTRKALEPQ